MRSDYKQTQRAKQVFIFCHQNANIYIYIKLDNKSFETVLKFKF